MGTAGEQGAIWGARAGDFAGANEPAWAGVYEAVLDRAGVGPGTRLLDIGCGSGGALLAARRRGAEIAGLDASEALVNIARRRLPGAVIEMGEMEELPFADGGFDAVTAINSLQFAAVIPNAMAEAERVLRLGGTLAVLVWGRREDCDILNKVMPVVSALLPAPAAVSPPPPPLSVSGAIEDLMRRAGLEPTSSEEIAGTLAFPDLDTALRAIMSATARAIAHAGPERVRDVVGTALFPCLQGDGTVRLDNRFRLVLASKTRRPSGLALRRERL
jgi:SAM-dependent methyltransferase